MKFIGKYTKFTNLDNDFGGGDPMGGFNALPNSTFDTETPGAIRLGSRMNDGGNSGGFPASNFDEEPPF